MRRVVVTGIGIVSSIGNNTKEVYNSLIHGKSGITKNEDMAFYGFRSQIAGNIKLDVSEHVDKRTLRFMGPGAAYAHIAMEQAINDSGLTEKEVSNIRTGLVAGSGGPSTSAMLTAHQTVLKNSIDLEVPQSTLFKRGRMFSVGPRFLRQTFVGGVIFLEGIIF